MAVWAYAWGPDIYRAGFAALATLMSVKHEALTKFLVCRLLLGNYMCMRAHSVAHCVLPNAVLDMLAIDEEADCESCYQSHGFYTQSCRTTGCVCVPQLQYDSLRAIGSRLESRSSAVFIH